MIWCPSSGQNVVDCSFVTIDMSRLKKALTPFFFKIFASGPLLSCSHVYAFMEGRHTSWDNCVFFLGAKMFTSQASSLQFTLPGVKLYAFMSPRICSCLSIGFVCARAAFELSISLSLNASLGINQRLVYSAYL